MSALYTSWVSGDTSIIKHSSCTETFISPWYKSLPFKSVCTCCPSQQISSTFLSKSDPNYTWASNVMFSSKSKVQFLKSQWQVYAVMILLHTSLEDIWCTFYQENLYQTLVLLGYQGSSFHARRIYSNSWKPVADVWLDRWCNSLPFKSSCACSTSQQMMRWWPRTKYRHNKVEPCELFRLSIHANGREEPIPIVHSPLHKTLLGYLCRWSCHPRV